MTPIDFISGGNFSEISTHLVCSEGREESQSPTLLQDFAPQGSEYAATRFSLCSVNPHLRGCKGLKP